jgi:ATP-dependent protease ClpP protease subunit
MSDTPTRIMVSSRQSNEYTLRIAREITEIDDFADELALLAGVTEDDTVRIQLITIGGRIDTSHMLVRAIRECKAHTIAYIGPTCASAGTVIALACEEWEIDEMSSFMIHAGSYGAYGKSGEVRSQVEHTTRVLERYIRNAYTGFLSDEEIERTLDGHDFYFDIENGLGERLRAYADHRAQARNDQLQQLQALAAELQEKLAELTDKLPDLAEAEPETGEVGVVGLVCDVAGPAPVAEKKPAKKRVVDKKDKQE